LAGMGASTGFLKVSMLTNDMISLRPLLSRKCKGGVRGLEV
jgi:hypothetical protein